MLPELSVFLPSETRSLILSHLSQSDLVSASIVSHSWHLYALPHLYRVFYVSEGSFLEQLSARIIAPNNLASTVARHVRELEIFHIGEEYKPHIMAILRAVPVLIHFGWGELQLESEILIMEALRCNCPNLTSLSVRFWAKTKRWESYDDVALFKFRGLRRLTLEIDNGTKFEDECVERFATLLRACPGLQTLGLTLSGLGINYSWSPSRLLTRLEDVTFQSLRSLHLSGCLVSSGSRDIDTVLRSFFARHPNLREIGFSSHPYLYYHISNLNGAFESLVHFEGSPLLCREVVEQQNAPPIEYLCINDLPWPRKWDHYVFRLRNFSLVFTELLTSHANIKKMINDRLDTVEELDIKAYILGVKAEAILDTSQFLPNLRRLNIGDSYVKMTPRASDWIRAARAYEAVCPRLEFSHSDQYGKVFRGCDIVDE